MITNYKHLVFTQLVVYVLQPFLLSELVIHQGTEVSDTEVRLEYGGHVTSLTMTSSTERGLWLRRLTQAKEEVTTSDRYKLQRQQSSTFLDLSQFLKQFDIYIPFRLMEFANLFSFLMLLKTIFILEYIIL